MQKFKRKLQSVSFFIVLATLSFSCNLVFAYSKPNHKLITKHAVELINSCELNFNISDQQLDELINNNLAQDNLLSKVVMWHFPLPPQHSQHTPPQTQESSVYGWLTEETTFNLWTSYLEHQAKMKQDFNLRLPATGAILHYIQDLASPSHAIPIFHPSKVINSDKFDDWDEFAESTLHSNFLCSGLNDAMQSDVSALLHKSRTATLLSLQQKHSENCQFTENCNWSVFWPEKIFEYGFGQYGCNGNDKFGTAGRFKCKDETLNISQQSYQRFARQRFSQAVVLSAKLIAYMFNLKPLPNEESSCQTDVWQPNRTVLKCIKNQ